MKKVLFLILIFIFFCSFFIGKGVNYGEEVSQVEIKIQNLKSENDFLETMIATRTSCQEVFKITQEKELISIALKR